MPITRGTRLVCDPAILPVALEACPVQHRILQLSRARDQLADGRHPETPGAAPTGLGRPAVCTYIAMSDRPTSLSSECGLGLIRRFRTAACRRVCRIATTNQVVFAPVRNEQFCFPFFLRPGNWTGRVVPCVIQYRKWFRSTVRRHQVCSRSGGRGMGGGIPSEGSWVFVPCYLQFRSKESSRSQRFQDPFPVGPPAESKFK